MRRWQYSAVPAFEANVRAGETPPLAVETRTFGVSQKDATVLDDWVEDVGRQWDMSARAVFGARLCIAELVNNVIEHGRARHEDDHVVVTLSRYDRGFGVEFMDTRGQFDPTVSIPRPKDLTESIGGRGLMLIRAFAGELGYRYDGRYNRTILKIASN
jgi:anti-sigma regulatory factor (Ser/Thr protein kinase)